MDLAGLARLKREGKKIVAVFNADPRGGPWASPIRNDKAFAAAYVKTANYEKLVEQMGRNLFDRDTSPGAEPEALLKLDIPALIIPGRDESHTTSAARYLEECLAKSQYWDVPPEAQTEQAAVQTLQSFLTSAKP